MSHRQYEKAVLGYSPERRRFLRRQGYRTEAAFQAGERDTNIDFLVLRARNHLLDRYVDFQRSQGVDLTYRQARADPQYREMADRLADLTRERRYLSESPFSSIEEWQQNRQALADLLGEIDVDQRSFWDEISPKG